MMRESRLPAKDVDSRMPQKPPPWTRPCAKWRRAALGPLKGQRRSLGTLRGVQYARLPPYRCRPGSDARLESVVLPSPPARLFLIEKQPKLHLESPSDMPQC